MKNKYILAYDFGTSGVKAAIVDFDGHLLGYEESGYPLSCPEVGWAEQDPDDYWTAVCDATKAVIKSVGVDGTDFAGMSFGTQGLGVIPLDKDGNTLYNNLTWIDTRAKAQADRINEACGVHALEASDTLPKILWLKENRPDVWEKTKAIVDCTGFLVYKMTGVMSAEYTGKVGYYQPDSADEEFAVKQFNAAGVELDKIPPLIPGGEYVGTLTDKASEELGISRDCKVFMGIVDCAVAALGAGNSKEADAHIYLGTSGWITAVIGDKYLTDATPGVIQLPSISVKNYLYHACVQSACLAFEWSLDSLYHAEKKEKGKEFYNWLNRELETIPPGSNGVLATPWVMGERSPILDENARALFLGISNRNTRADMVNAVMEGICFSIRMQVRDYKKDTGYELDSVSAIGGGCMSDHWMQMMADVLKMPVHRTENCRHSGAIGAAAIVAVGLGECELTGVDRFVNIERTFYPDAEAGKIYDKYYDLWCDIYPSLKDLFVKMKKVNG